jgi:two-component system cell cycle sensor histidine kinase/response regulator CckA
MSGASGAPGEVRTENFDLDLRRRNGQFLPVRLYHRIAFGQDGKAGPSRTLVLSRSPGQDSEEAQRAAEVRFARFFNNTPIAIATVGRDARVLRANAAFAGLFPTLPRAGKGSEAPILSAVADVNRPAVELALRAAAEGRSDIPPVELQVAGEGGRSVRMWVSPASEGEGGDESAVLYALDTTELRRVEEKLAQAQKMNAVGQLAAASRTTSTTCCRRSSAIATFCSQAIGRRTRPSRISSRSSRTPTGPRASCGSSWPFRAGRPCGRRS